MIESNKICEILQGSNIYSTFYIKGWCKTSSGASFGKERIKELLDYIELEKNDIGLKDTNGNSIYADSSIVEFEWGQDKHNIIGYFTYNKQFLQYEIIMLNIQHKESMSYSPFTCFDFKIIDTIQENKLGLIK